MAKMTPYGPIPTPLEALRALADEFDRYSEQMTRIGRGHGDYGAERAIARMVLADHEDPDVAEAIRRADDACHNCGRLHDGACALEDTGDL